MGEGFNLVPHVAFELVDVVGMEGPVELHAAPPRGDGFIEVEEVIHGSGSGLD
jgi:hypothetical protein